MTARRSSRSFRPSMDVLQDRIAPVSLYNVPALQLDLSLVTSSPIDTTTPPSTGGAGLIATAPICTTSR